MPSWRHPRFSVHRLPLTAVAGHSNPLGMRDFRVLIGIVILFMSEAALSIHTMRTHDALIVRKERDSFQILLCADNTPFCHELTPIPLDHWKPFLSKLEEEANRSANIRPEGAVAAVVIGGSVTAIAYKVTSASNHDAPTRRRVLAGLACLSLFGGTTAAGIAAYDWLILPPHGSELIRMIAQQTENVQVGERRMYRILEEDAVWWKAIGERLKLGPFY